MNRPLRSAGLSGFDRAEQQAGFLADLFGDGLREPDGLRADAEVAALDPAVAQQRIGHPADGAGRDGERDVAEHGRGVEAEELAGRADQRAAGEAGIHQRIGLQVVVKLAAGGRAPVLLQRADDPQGRHDALTGPAERERQVPDVERLAVGPGGDRQALGGRAEQRQVGGRVAADEGRGDRAAVREADADVFILLDDVMRGDDQAVGGPDDAAGGEASPALHPHDAGSRGLHCRR